MSTSGGGVTSYGTYYGAFGIGATIGSLVTQGFGGFGNYSLAGYDGASDDENEDDDQTETPPPEDEVISYGTIIRHDNNGILKPPWLDDPEYNDYLVPSIDDLLINLCGLPITPDGSIVPDVPLDL